MKGGAAPLGITFEELRAWLELNGVTDEEERSDLAYFVHELDLVFLAWEAKKNAV